MPNDRRLPPSTTPKPDGLNAMDGPPFDDTFKDDVKARTSIVALISERVRLKRRGKLWVACCPFHSEKTPSFKVDESKASYRCYGCGKSGDVFTWLQETTNLDFKGALHELAVRAGLRPATDGQQRPVAKPIARPKRADIERSRVKEMEKSRRIWDECHSAPGTLVDTYLSSRGIVLPIPPSIKFHPGLDYWVEREDAEGNELPPEKIGNWPAMVGFVQGPDRRFIGIHRTWLAYDGSDKADIAGGFPARKMRGNAFGGHLRLCPADQAMGVAEGIETALSVMQVTKLPVWAALAEGNLGAALPEKVTEVTVCADNDTKDKNTTRQRLDAAARAHRRRGLTVNEAMPPDGYDFNDLLQLAAQTHGHTGVVPRLDGDD